MHLQKPQVNLVMLFAISQVYYVATLLHTFCKPMPVSKTPTPMPPSIISINHPLNRILDVGGALFLDISSRKGVSNSPLFKFGVDHVNLWPQQVIRIVTETKFVYLHTCS